MQHHPGGVSGVSMLDGHLEMKTKRWKCYYVQLIGRQLLLFHDLNQPPMFINIPEETTCKIGKSKRNNFQFSLHTDKTRFFRVPSELHRAKWMMHILEASRGDFSPKRQASQRSLYSINSISSAGSWCEGAPPEYLQFCRRTRSSRSTDSSPSEGDLGRRSIVTRRSLADCHLPLNNMRWYESAPPTPIPVVTSGPLDREEVDPDIISLPDVSAALLQQRKPRQMLQRTGAVENLGTLDVLSKCSKFQDLSTLQFSDSSGSPQGDTGDTMETIDSYANFLQWSTYTPASIDALNTSLIQLIEPPRFHRSTSLPHSLKEVAGDIYAPQEWVHTRTHPTLSALSEHSATPQNSYDTNSPDYENLNNFPPDLPERVRPPLPGPHDNLIEVSNHMNISDPELFPPAPSFNLRRSVLSSITRRNAEEILAVMAPGTFLVRYRESNHHQLALSIRMGDSVLHHCILSEPGGCYAIQGFDCHANSLDSLLQAFIRARNGEVSLYCPDEPLSDDDGLEWQSNNSVNAIL